MIDYYMRIFLLIIFFVFVSCQSDFNEDIWMNDPENQYEMIDDLT